MTTTIERPSDVLAEPARSGRFRSSAGEAPPPRVGAWPAVRRHWLMACLPALLLAFAAVTIAFQRDPTYTAQARLNVGRLDVGAQSIPGLVQGSQALASAYSRVIDAQPVVKPVAAKAGLSPDDVAERLSSSAIPESPLLYVEAESESASKAVEMANLASDALIEHVTALSRASSDGPRLLQEFRAASRSFEGLVAKRRRLDAVVERSPRERNRKAAEKVAADAEAANLRMRTLSSLYETSQQGQSATTLLQVLSPATAADSDRISVLQRLLFLALIAGVASGVALAVVRANRTARPRHAAAVGAGPPQRGEPGPGTADVTSAGPGPRRRLARWTLSVFAVAALLASALLTALFALDKWEPANPLGGSVAPRPAAPSPPPASPPSKTGSTAVTASPAPRDVSLQLLPEGQVWTCLVDAKGRRLVAGRLLEAGAATRTYRSKSFRVSFGNAEITMKIDGRRRSVSGTGSPIGYAVTRAGRKPLAPQQQPSCGQAASASASAQG